MVVRSLGASAGATHVPSRSDGDDHGGRTAFAFLAETSRHLADSLDYHTTLATVAHLALPHFGTWCMVDVVEPDGAIRRVAVIHPDAGKQREAREFYRRHPPRREDPIGAPRVIRTHHSEFSAIAVENALEGIADIEHRELLEQLGARRFLIVPLRARGRTLGAITFVSDEQAHYDEADLLLAEDLGRRCGMAIDNARLYTMAEGARQAAEGAREDAAFAAQRADTLREVADLARHEAETLREVADTARHEAETANRAKATFLTTMSHEFRTPLGAIIGFVDLLSDELAGPLTPVQRNYLSRVGKASGHLLRLIEEVLTISQVHAGRGRVQLEEVDLSTIVLDVAELIQPLAAARKLAIEVDLPATPVLFATDAAKFRQIVINLAGNALKFTPSGEVRLSLAEEGGAIVFSVRDTGVGVSAEEAERLFESFWQANRATAGQGRGTGLGLAITRQLAQLMGGDVTLDSTPGHGSTFTVRLPRVGAEDGRTVSVEAEAPPTRKTRTRA